MEMCKNEHFVKNIVQFFKTFKSNIFIIIRASFILASKNKKFFMNMVMLLAIPYLNLPYILFYCEFSLDMTTFIEDIRKFIYFKLKGFRDIYDCFCFYSTKEHSKNNNSDLVD